MFLFLWFARWRAWLGTSIQSQSRSSIGHEWLSTFATPWKGENLRAKNSDAVCEGSAEARSALCADVGEAKRTKVTGSYMECRKINGVVFPFICSLGKDART